MVFTTSAAGLYGNFGQANSPHGGARSVSCNSRCGDAPAASVKNMYYRAKDRGGSFRYDAPLFGLRLGYVHWLSDRIGVVLNSSARLSVEDTWTYSSLDVRVGVSGRL